MNRTEFKKIEPITLVAEFTTGLDPVNLSLYDARDLTPLLVDQEMMELDSLNLPGIYTITFSVAALDAILVDGQPLQEIPVLWQAGPATADPDDPPQYGTFVRGGWVDQLETIKAAEISIATVKIPERNVEAGQISHVDYPLGYGKLLRMTFFYKAGSNDPISVTTTVEDA